MVYNIHSFQTATFLFLLHLLQQALKIPQTSGQIKTMPWGCQVHPKTSGAFNRCAKHTIWRSVSAVRQLSGKGLPAQAARFKDGKRPQSWIKPLNNILNNVYSNNVFSQRRKKKTDTYFKLICGPPSENTGICVGV